MRAWLPILFPSMGLASPIPKDLSIGAFEIASGRTPASIFLDNVARGGRYVPGELLVAGEASIVAARSGALDCHVVRGLGRRPLFVVACDPRVPMRGLLDAWAATPGVAWVEASFLEREEAAPNDLDPGQWYHQNTGQPIRGFRGVAGADISSLDAWDIATGDQRRVILISDVGVYPDHEDLTDQIWINDDEICGNGRDDDANGYVDDCRGFDFGDEDADPSPATLPALREDGTECPKWHATMIAGLAAARGDNGVGVAGINWNVSMMNVKKHRDATCESTTTRTIESITYAIDNGADVISMSFNSSSYSATFEAALQAAERAGLILVSSGGNGGTDDDMERRYPNQYDLTANLVVVNSTNQDVLYPGSNWGAFTVDMAAPGTDVMSTSMDAPNAYGWGTGASYSAAFAAGAATLVWSAFPALSNLEVTKAIEEGVTPLDSMDCALTARCVRTGGRIDLYGAMSRAAELAPPSVFAKASLPEVVPGNEADLAVELVNMGRGPALGLTVRIVNGGGLGITIWETSAGTLASAATSNATGLRVQVPIECTAHDTTIILGFSDRFGRSWEESLPLHVPCGAPPPVIEPEEKEPHEEDEGAGCSAAGSDASIVWIALAAYVSARRRR
jgi:uncharacterized protein (TIGR03382 family)